MELKNTSFLSPICLASSCGRDYLLLLLLLPLVYNVQAKHLSHTFFLSRPCPTAEEENTIKRPKMNPEERNVINIDLPLLWLNTDPSRE